MNSIEQNALYLLKLLVEKDKRMGGIELSKLSNFSPRDINDAIDYLKRKGAIDVLEALRTAPYNFANVDVNSRGRYLYHEVFSEASGSIIDSSNPSSFMGYKKEFSTNETKEQQNNENRKLKVFISYSTEDKYIAEKIKKILESFGINSFMAHSDIFVSEEWRVRIVEELKEADVFVPVLSTNFRKSDWCSQESGIACFRDILFIPLSLDDTKPYGFMSHRQGSKKIIDHNIPLHYIMKPINDNFNEINVIRILINRLKKHDSYGKSEENFGNLEPYFNQLTAAEVNKVIDISIENNQIYQADLFRSKYLPKLIEIHQEKINKTKLEKLLELIND